MREDINCPFCHEPLRIVPDSEALSYVDCGVIGCLAWGTRPLGIYETGAEQWYLQRDFILHFTKELRLNLKLAEEALVRVME